MGTQVWIQCQAQAPGLAALHEMRQRTMEIVKLESEGKSQSQKPKDFGSPLKV